MGTSNASSPQPLWSRVKGLEDENRALRFMLGLWPGNEPVSGKEYKDVSELAEHIRYMAGAK